MRRLGRWLLSLFPVPLPLPPSPSFPLFLHSLCCEKTKPCLIVVWFISWWCGYQFLSLTLPLTLAPSLSFPHTLPLHFAPYLSSFPLLCKQITAMAHCCLVFNQCSTSTTKFEEAQRKIFVWRWVGHGEQRFSHWLALSPTHSLSLTDSLPCPIHSVLSADSSHVNCCLVFLSWCREYQYLPPATLCLALFFPSLTHTLSFLFSLSVSLPILMVDCCLVFSHGSVSINFSLSFPFLRALSHSLSHTHSALSPIQYTVPLRK